MYLRKKRRRKRRNEKTRWNENLIKKSVNIFHIITSFLSPYRWLYPYDETLTKEIVRVSLLNIMYHAQFNKETMVIFNRRLEESKEEDWLDIPRKQTLTSNGGVSNPDARPRACTTPVSARGLRGEQQRGRERSNADTVSPSLLPLFASASKPSFITVFQPAVRFPHPVDVKKKRNWKRHVGYQEHTLSTDRTREIRRKIDISPCVDLSGGIWSGSVEWEDSDTIAEGIVKAENFCSSGGEIKAEGSKAVVDGETSSK